MKDLEKVKKSILEAASYLFERFGYEKTSMDEIARRAHKAKASLYYHFEGKQELLQVVLRSEFEEMQRRLEKVKKEYENDIRGQLVTYLTLRMKLVRETKVYRHYVTSPYLEHPDEVADMVRDLRASFDAWECSYFENVCKSRFAGDEHAKAVDPAVFGKMMVVLIKGLELQFFRLDDYETMKGTYEALVELLVPANDAIKYLDDRVANRVSR